MTRNQFNLDWKSVLFATPNCSVKPTDQRVVPALSRSQWGHSYLFFFFSDHWKYCQITRIECIARLILETNFSFLFSILFKISEKYPKPLVFQIWNSQECFFFLSSWKNTWVKSHFLCKKRFILPVFISSPVEDTERNKTADYSNKPVIWLETTLITLLLRGSPLCWKVCLAASHVIESGTRTGIKGHV